MQLTDFISGSLAGAFGFILGYPLETVRSRIQTQKQFTGIWQCTVLTFTKEGVSGFFKGMSLPVSTVSVTSSVLFGTYRNCLLCLNQARGGDCMGPNQKGDILLAGTLAGTVQSAFLAPSDIVKVRLQCQTESKRAGANAPKPKYSGPINCLVTTIREEGVRGLYRGIVPLILRDAPAYAAYFWSYAVCREMLTDVGKDKPDWGGIMLAGGIAGSMGWIVGSPMDVIKSRLQVDGIRGTNQYRGFYHCLTETVRTEGAGVFTRTVGISVLRAFPVGIVVFPTYEVISSFLQPGPDRMELPWRKK